MGCPVCLSPDATTREEPLQLHIDCEKCGGPFVLTSAAVRRLAGVASEERAHLSECVAREREERLITEAFVAWCLD
jgi:hypothetical protein